MIKSTSLNILQVLINTKSQVINHLYAGQWLLESLIDVLKKREKHGSTFRAIEDWYEQENKEHFPKPRKLAKQHVLELTKVALHFVEEDFGTMEEFIKRLEAAV